MILTCPVGRDRKNNNGCRSELRTCSIILINFINRIQANKFTSKPLGGTETSSRAMKGDEAKILLGFPPNSTPTSSQVSEAYSHLLSGKFFRFLCCLFYLVMLLVMVCKFSNGPQLVADKSAVSMYDLQVGTMLRNKMGL
ncbi:unnamed protein product [Linum tenue]|uniref:Uncharacterized protein n=1 Tax=Linum tenue TaxID=586396 RepID=A0AAV0PGV2_9ROSI|nr:unnamed protein product [Linum tenue]